MFRRTNRLPSRTSFVGLLIWMLAMSVLDARAQDVPAQENVIREQPVASAPSPSQSPHATATIGATPPAPNVTANASPAPTPIVPMPSPTPRPHRAKGTPNPLRVKFLTPSKGTAYVDGQEVGQLGTDSVQVLGNLTVVVEATDSIGGIEKIELFVDGKLRATGTVTPFGWRWPTGSETTGVHELAVRARDRAGNERISRLKVATLAQ